MAPQKRKRLTEREVIDVLIAQGVSIPCPCPRCRERKPHFLNYWIASGADAIREHLHQLATGGEDSPSNWQYWYIGCAGRKTHGTKATSYGSDAHARAKVKRLEKQRGGLARAASLSPERRTEIAKKAAKTRWAKRKIPSRPFRRKP